MSAITKAIQTVGLTRLAARIGCSYQAIRKWEKRGNVPAARVLPIYHATRGAVTPHDLRPDLYKPDRLPPLEPMEAPVLPGAQAADFEALARVIWEHAIAVIEINEPRSIEYKAGMLRGIRWELGLESNTIARSHPYNLGSASLDAYLAGYEYGRGHMKNDFEKSMRINRAAI